MKKFMTANPLGLPAEYNGGTEVPSFGKKANVFRVLLSATVIIMCFLLSAPSYARGEHLKIGGSIVVIDDASTVRVDVEGATATIIVTEVYTYPGSSFVTSDDTCTQNVCTYDFDALSPGYYTIVVHTTQGTFSGVVKLK